MIRYFILSSFVCCLLCLSVICSVENIYAEDKNGLSPSRLKLPKGPGSLEGIGENIEHPQRAGLDHELKGPRKEVVADQNARFIVPQQVHRRTPPTLAALIHHIIMHQISPRRSTHQPSTARHNTPQHNANRDHAAQRIAPRQGTARGDPTQRNT